MSHAPPLRRLAAIVACSASLAATAGLAPTPAGAAAAHSCGAKTIAFNRGGKSVEVPASRIRVEGGATCAEAVAVIRGTVLRRLPKGWSAAKAEFKAPHGLTPHLAVNGHKKVKFDLVGPG